MFQEVCKGLEGTWKAFTPNGYPERSKYNIAKQKRARNSVPPVGNQAAVVQFSLAIPRLIIGLFPVLGEQIAKDRVQDLCRNAIHGVAGLISL